MIELTFKSRERAFAYYRTKLADGSYCSEPWFDGDVWIVRMVET